jgi:FMN-dependent dehydrogenase
LWFQAYILKDKAFLARMIERARAAEYEALMITVDLPVGGKRERDQRNHFSVPFRFTPKNVWDFAQKPGWCWRMLRHGMPVMENLIGLDDQAKSASSMASSVGRNYDASFDWEALQRIRDQWPRQLILKGVMHPDDADRACAMGCDALVVSNHGGRQLDGALATLDACPAWFRLRRNAFRCGSMVASDEVKMWSRHWRWAPAVCCWDVPLCLAPCQTANGARTVHWKFCRPSWCAPYSCAGCEVWPISPPRCWRR